MAESINQEIPAMKNVACVGILVADVIIDTVTEYPQKGIMSPVNSITVHNGGNAMTAAINIKKLGVQSAIVGKVGTDMFGTYLKNRLDDSDVDTSGLKFDSSVQTSASVLMIDPSGERSYFHCVGTNAVFSVDDIDFDIIEKSDIVFVTGSFLMNRFDGKETMEFLKKCKSMGKTTFLDVCWDASGRWGELLDMAMPYIDFFMPSIDEAENIAKSKAPEEIADVFMAKGVSNVVIKMGGEGCFVKKNGDEKGRMFPAIKGIKAVDTTGAGDSFCSGFIAAYANGEDIDFCASFANATGAISVTQKGATSAIESYDKTLKVMRGEK